VYNDRAVAVYWLLW